MQFERLQIIPFFPDEDEKTILSLENLNKSLSAEIKEVKKELSQLQENLKISEDTNLQFEGQLTKTIKGLATVMDEIHMVLKKVKLSVTLLQNFPRIGKAECLNLGYCSFSLIHCLLFL